MDEFTKKLKNIIPIFKGGQKQVYKAEHDEYGIVAFKTGKYTSSKTLERIKREISFLHDIDSTFYPKNYESFFDEDNKTFFIIRDYHRP